MDKNIVISVENVSKRFKVYFDKGTSLKEKVLFRNRRRFEEREVLQNINFQVSKGQAVGIIGHNGCGKSTLLKLLTKIMYPETGRIVTTGRISALIELGAGFHPDMSGRENIYTNAAIFGLSREEIDRRLDKIIEFSELEEFIDNPVRTYSSGMYMRLAFSVAINVDADILLVDEILAVGDASFQAKCFNRLREIKASGTTIVIVSHSLGQIEQICDRSIWINDGKIRADGPPREVHPAYLNYMAQQYVEHAASGVAALSQEQSAESPQPETSGQEGKQSSVETKAGETVSEEIKKTRWGNREAEFTRIRLLDEKGVEREAFLTGEPMTIEMTYTARWPISNAVCGIGIFRADELNCYGTNTQLDHIHDLHLAEHGVIRFVIEANMLLPGQYTLDVALQSENGFDYDYFRFAKRFQMHSEYTEAGVVRLQHTWVVDGKEIR